MNVFTIGVESSRFRRIHRRAFEQPIAFPRSFPLRLSAGAAALLRRFFKGLLNVRVQPFIHRVFHTTDVVRIQLRGD
jgi:hypothetical protein